MVNVQYPQKSNFGTLTATKIVCPELDSGVGDLKLKRAGASHVDLGADYVTNYKHVRLVTGKNIVDQSLSIIIGTDDVGNIDDLAPITDALGVRTAIVNNPVDDLILQRVGGTRLVVTNTDIQMYRAIKLLANIEVRDSSDAVLLAGDNSGNIDQLGRVDIPVTNPTGSQEVALVPMELISPSQSGTLDEDEGFWYTDASDILYLYLNTVLHYLMLRGTVYLESITVYINTPENNDYVTSLTLEKFAVTTGNSMGAVVEGTDIGGASSGDANGTITINAVLVTNAWYRLAVNAVVGTTGVTVRAIKIVYKLT